MEHTDRPVRQIFVFNPDGTPAPFSGFSTIAVGPDTDTLFSDARGLRTDHEGNVLIATQNGRLYRVNYLNGTGMNRAVVSPGMSLTAPCVTSTGEVIVGNVAFGTNVVILDEDLTFLRSAFGPTNVVCALDGGNQGG